MKRFFIKPAVFLNGELSVPGDKSIAHRAVIIGAISLGKVSIENFPFNKDCLSTLSAVKDLGIKVNKSKQGLVVFGKGLWGLKKPQSPIFIKESGTTFRLLLGLLAAQGFNSKLLAGSLLSRRPMLRVISPLRMMGANIAAKCSLPVLPPEEYPPISIVGSKLAPIKYRMPVASAQVKSAILLAGLYTKGCTEIIEPLVCRDHTERMLKVFKSNISVKRNKIRICGRKELLSPGKVYVPGDISSAAFFMVAAAIVPNSQIRIKNVSLNPTRTGVLNVLKRMGADIRVQAQGVSQGEPLGDLIVKHSQLKKTRIKNKEIPFLIDELPVLMVAACFAKGKSIFEGVKELRVKETDRIQSMCFNLKRMGAKIKVRKSGNNELIEIEGVKALNGAELKSFGDHRTAMSAIVAGLSANGTSHIDDIECIKKSFPGFLPVLKGLLPS